MTIKKSPDKGAQDDVEVGCDAALNDTVIEKEDNIVISGVACRLSTADNMTDLRDNLLSGTSHSASPASRKYGGMKDLDKFDAKYFGVSPQQAQRMDPQLRILLELTAEALIDAGFHPLSEYGMKVAVFVGLESVHAYEALSSSPDQPDAGLVAGGCKKNMIANRIAYTFKFSGPSYCIQGGNVAGSLALARAYQCLNDAEIDMAVVAGSCLCLKHFQNSGMKQASNMPGNRDNACGCHGNNGMVVMILQRYPLANRVYATIVNCSAQISPPSTGLLCCEGHGYPTQKSQQEFLQKVYAEADIEPNDVEYVEISSCSLHESDMTEISALLSVLSIERDLSLLIGSTRSHDGHIAAASGLVPIAKLLIAMEDAMIPPSHQLAIQDQCIPQGVEVVTENTCTLDNCMSVNTLGQGGYHAHTILIPNDKKRVLLYCLADKPRLCVYAGSSEKGLESVFKFLQKHSLDMELHALLNETSSSPPYARPYRGYCILNNKDKQINIQACPDSGAHRPVWFVFSGMGCQWVGMGHKLMSLATFSSSIMESNDTLKKYGINLHKMITSGTDENYDKPLTAFIGITAIQIALVNLLREMDIEPDGIIGHSIGEIACGFADDSLTAQEAILAAYWRGFSIQQADLKPGLMAAVGLSWEEAVSQCPPGVVPACHNSPDTVTISGSTQDVQPFLTQLRERGVYVRELNTAGVAFHTPHMQEVVPMFREYLSKLITPKKRSKRWVSTSIPADRWDSDLAKNCSVEYFVNNLTSPVLFQEALQHVPENAIVIEIGPHTLLQTILRKTLTKSPFHTGLMSKDSPDSVTELFSNLGKCYMHGMDLNPLGIFPPILYPVSRGTPMISPLITWDHSQTWDIPNPAHFITPVCKPHPHSTITIDPCPGGSEYNLTGHVISGRTLFPVAGYILLAWKTLANFCDEVHNNFPVSLEKITIHRPVIISQTDKLTFDVTINAWNAFEILEGRVLVCSGTICAKSVFMSVPDNTSALSPISPRRHNVQLTASEIYTELSYAGFGYEGDFKSIVEANITGEHGLLKWTDDWVTFLDGMLQLMVLAKFRTSPCLPVYIGSILINPLKHLDRVWKHHSKETVSTATADRLSNTVIAGGVAIHGMTFNPVRLPLIQPPLVQQIVFIPYIQKGKELISGDADLTWYVEDCRQLAVQSLRSVWDSLSTIGGINRLHNKSDIEKLLQEQSGDKFAIIGDVDMRNYSKCKNCGLLKLLEKIEALPAVENFMENMNSLFDAYEEDVYSDQLMARSVSSDFLKPSLDIVCENLSSDVLRMLEVGGVKGQSAYKEIKGNLTCDLGMGVDYTVTGIKAPPEGVNILKWSLSEDADTGIEPFQLLFLNNVLSSCPNVTKALRNAVKVVTDNGFILVEEPTDNLPIALVLHGFTENWNHIEDKELRHIGRWLNKEAWLDLFDSVGLKLVSTRTNGIYCSLFLLRKPSCNLVLQEHQTVLDMSRVESKHIDELEKTMVAVQSRAPGSNVWLAAGDSPDSGVVGMVQALRKQPGGDRIRCVLLEDTCLGVTVANLKESEVFHDLVSKDLVINVYKGGEWGSYRQMPLHLGKHKQTFTPAACVQPLETPSTPSWVVSPLCFPSQDELNSDLLLCYPRYASVSAKDQAMLRAPYRSKHETPRVSDILSMGSEFSGFNGKGQRVMGIASRGALSTQVYVDHHWVWPVPESWTLQQACTVPKAYTTAYFGLISCANIHKKQGQSVLIIGSNQTSHAAISVSLHYKCQVLVAMETKEALDMVTKKFGNKLSTLLLEDTYFFIDVKRKTKMRGVDVVFDCMVEPSVAQYTTSYLRSGGHLVQCPPHNENKVTASLGNLSLQPSFCTVSCVQLDNLEPEDRHILADLITEGIKAGVVTPFDAAIFDKDRLTDAFMANSSDKSVLVKISEDLTGGPAKVLAQTHLLLDPLKCYLVTGVLSGVGLHLAQWLVAHGAAKLFLNDTGLKTGFEKRMCHMWQSQGVTVTVSAKDIKSEMETTELIREAKSLGPVGGIFHVVMVDTFEPLTPESKEGLLMNQVSSILNLDHETRSACSRTLEYFVSFIYKAVNSGKKEKLSSAQNINAYAKTALERICARRNKEGFPGIAIQLGLMNFEEKHSKEKTIVGIPKENSLQKVTISCLHSLDHLLMQQKPVISCKVPEKAQENTDKVKQEVDFFQKTCQVLGVTKENLPNDEWHVGDFGLDILDKTELQSELRKTAGLTLADEDLEALTICDIQAIAEVDREGKKQKENIDLHLEDVKEKLYREISMTQEPLTKLNQANNDAVPIFLVMDEENQQELELLVASLACPVYGLHRSEKVPFFSVSSLASFFLQQIYIINNDRPLILSGYKFGCVIAMEMAIQLQQTEAIPVQHVIFIEGSQSYIPLSENRQLLVSEISILPEESRVREALTVFVEMYTTCDVQILKIMGTDMDEVGAKCCALVKYLTTKKELASLVGAEKELQRQMMVFVHKYLQVSKYRPDTTYNGDVSLIRGRNISKDIKLSGDYNLSEACSGRVLVHILNSQHEELLRTMREDVAATINATHRKVSKPVSTT